MLKCLTEIFARKDPSTKQIKRMQREVDLRNFAVDDKQNPTDKPGENIQTCIDLSIDHEVIKLLHREQDIVKPILTRQHGQIGFLEDYDPWNIFYIFGSNFVLLSEQNMNKLKKSFVKKNDYGENICFKKFNIEVDYFNDKNIALNLNDFDLSLYNFDLGKTDEFIEKFQNIFDYIFTMYQDDYRFFFYSTFCKSRVPSFFIMFLIYMGKMKRFWVELFINKKMEDFQRKMPLTFDEIYSFITKDRNFDILFHHYIFLLKFFDKIFEKQ